MKTKETDTSHLQTKGKIIVSSLWVKEWMNGHGNSFVLFFNYFILMENCAMYI